MFFQSNNVVVDKKMKYRLKIKWLQLFLASLFAGIGTYVLRKGDLFNTFNSIINLSPTDNKIIFFTLIGIFLNLIAIAFWQSIVLRVIYLSI